MNSAKIFLYVLAVSAFIVTGLMFSQGCEDSEHLSKALNSKGDTPTLEYVGSLRTEGYMEYTREYYSNGDVKDNAISLVKYPEWRKADTLRGYDGRGTLEWAMIASGKWDINEYGEYIQVRE